MTVFNVISFFFNQIEKKNWFYVTLNYFLVLFIAFVDIIFLGIFYLLLNKQTGSQFFNLFIDNLNFLKNIFFLELDLDKLYIILLLLLLFLKNFLSFFQNYFYSSFIFKITLNKSSKILSTYLALDFQSFNQKELSIYIKQAVRDVESAFLGIFGLTISLFGEITYITALLLYLNYLISLNLNIEIIILFIIIIFITYYLFRLSDKLGSLRAINEIKVFKTLNDTLSLFKELKLNNQSLGFVQRYKNFLANYYKSRIYSGLINISPKFILEFSAIIFFYFLYTDSNLNINQFFVKFSVLAIAMLRLIPSFSKLSYYTTTILYSMHSIEFIKSDLNKKIKLKSRESKYKIIDNIKLKNISLNYYSKNTSGSHKIFDNFSLSLKKNNIYGIYGASGSGKSSLLNILIGFIKPQKGKVYFNNKRQIFQQISDNFKIGFLPQHQVILDESIIINSTLKFNSNIDEINKVKFYLKKFNLNRFLNYNFISNDNAQTIKNMSGGEKQRISFIRSIINNPDLLILDEPVSSLDLKNAHKIFNFLQNYKKDRIIIVTSHKNSEKKFFDKVIYL